MTSHPRPGSRPSRAARLAVVVAIGLTVGAPLVTACGTDAGSAAPEGRTPLRVFAASSLTEVMTELAMAFEEGDPTTSIELNLAGSPTLRTQILEGAPADVVATANPTVLEELVAAGAVTAAPATFATNRLVLAVAPGNPGGVADLGDLADGDLFVGLCAAGVPCGDLADAILDRAGVEVEPDTREPDVRALLTKVATGELDAGLVYATDLLTDLARTEGVEGVDLPADLTPITRYPAAVVSGTGQPDRARAFVDFLTGERGRAILVDHGFGAP